MARYNTLTIGVLALALAAGACNRDAKDTRKEAITFHRVAYDNLAAARKIRDAGLPEAHAYRVEKGI